jgi:hypothetical protein
MKNRNICIVISFLCAFNSLAQEGADFDAMYKDLLTDKVTTVFESDKYLIREIKTAYWKKDGKETAIAYKFLTYDLVAKNGSSKQIKFDYITMKSDLPNGLYYISQKDKDGLISINSGVLVVPCLYERVEKLTDSLYLGSKNGKFLYDLNGKLVVPKPFKYPVLQKEHKFIYDSDAKELVLYNLNGTLRYNFHAKLIGKAADYFILEKNGKQGIVDFNGKELLPFVYQSVDVGDNKGYIIIGNKTDEGTKYGMYTDYTLKNEIFPLKYDYLNEIALFDEDARENTDVLCFKNKSDHVLKVLDSTKKEILQFKEVLNDLESITKIADYYLLFNEYGEFEIYTKGAGPVQNSSYYTEFFRLTSTKGLEDYIQFNSDNTRRSALLPEKYGTKRNYLFNAEYPAFTYHSKNCYSIIDEIRGSGFFLPKRSNPFIYIQKQPFEAWALDDLVKSMNVVIQVSEEAGLLMYDLHTDSLVHLPASKTYGINGLTAMNYICNKVNPYLQKNFKVAHETIELSHDKENSFMYNWIDASTNQKLFSVPFAVAFNYNSLSVNDHQNKNITNHNFKVWSMGFEDPSRDNRMYTISALFTDNWKLIKPMGHGQISRIMVLPNDTIVGIEFSAYGDIDSMQVYSVARKKTMYYSQLKKLVGKTFFYPQFNGFGITNGEGTTGLISYDGKLLVPFNFEEYSADKDFTMLTFFGGKSLYYFPKFNVSINGEMSDEGFLFTGSDCFALPDKHEQYGIYDIKTGKQLLPHVSGYPDYAVNNRYIWVGHEDKYGVFDLQDQKLVEEIKYTSDDMNRIYEEKKYVNVKLEEK